MSVPALNAAAIANAPNAAAKAGGASAAAGPLGGFEALMAALFPPADGAPQSPPAGGAKPGLVKGADKHDDDKDQDATPSVSAPATDASTAASDAGASILAAAMTQAQAPAPIETPKGDAQTDETATPAAWGRDKAPATPAAPALAHRHRADPASSASPAAPAAPDAAGVGQATAAAAAEAADPASTPVQDVTTQAAIEGDTPEPKGTGAPNAAPGGGAASDAVTRQAPPAWGQGKPAGVPAAPALQNANPHARMDEKAAAPPPVDAPPPLEAVEPAPAQAAAVTAEAAAEPPAEPPVQSAPQPKAAKADRGKGEVGREVSPNLKPSEAVDRPVHGKPVEANTKIESATLEAPEPKAAETKTAAADTPDATPQGEAQAAIQANAAPPAHTTHAVRGAPDTVAALAAKIVKKLEGDSTRFDLELDPAGLGKVDVRLEINAHGRLSASLTCDNPQAAAELKARAAELQRTLEQSGFDLSGGLSFDVAGDHRQGQQGQGWQDLSDQGGQAFRGQAFRAALDTAADVAQAADHGALRLRRGVTAGLDLRI